MRSRSTVVGTAIIGLGLLGAAPAVAGAMHGGSRQPPADAPAVHVRVPQPGPEAQPPNLHPFDAGRPTQVQGPRERTSPPSYDAGRVDEGGVDGSDRSGGRKD